MKRIFTTLLCSFFGVFILSLSLFAGDIVIFGDSQIDEISQRKVVQAVLSVNPSIVFRLGDNVEDGNDHNEWRAFNDINKPLLNTAEYFPALGNHEQDSRLYFDNFPFLNHRRWYSVERKGIHFIVLDSNSPLGRLSEQYNWLKSDLDSIEDSVKFRIVLLHHPIFTVGPHREDEKNLRDILLPLFKKYGVAAVFSGHNHNYQRLKYQGIDFIVTGGGGARLRDSNRTSPYLKKFVKVYHFCLLSPGDDSLGVRVIDADLNVIDEFNIPAIKPALQSSLHNICRITVCFT